MNFWQKTQRFTEPLWISKKNLFLTILINAAYSIGKIVPVILLILSQTSSTYTGFYISGAIAYVFFGVIIVRTLRVYYWLIPAYSHLDYITTKSVEELIQKNNLVYENIGTGRVVSIVDRGFYMWPVLLTNGFAFLINTFIVGVFIFIRVSFIDWKYGVVLIGVMICILAWIIRNNNKALVWKKKLKEKESENTRRLVKIFMSKFEVLQNKKIKSEQQWLKSNIHEQLEIAEKRNRYLTYMYDLPYFGFLGGIVTIFCLSYFKILSINPTLLVELVGFSVLIQSMLMPYIDFIKDFTKDFVHIEKLWDFIDNTPKIEGYTEGKSFVFKKGDYSIKNLTFQYDRKPVFTAFDLEITGGKRTALVGRSGSGKTTLMKLLAGYMRPTSGELLIDGQEITSTRLDSYYPHIGYLTQEPSVFDGTIEENLLYGTKKKPTKKDIEQAVELAECQFIYELEEGIKTEIGERGVRLSGGQKQRLAIAKIFLKNPEIILLDEPTAALDSYSEQKVAKAFEHLFEGRTVIVIAHRLQTVKSADDIIVLEKGKIVERGTHKELLKLGKKYAGMVDLQSGVVKEDNNEEVYEK